MTTSGRRRWSSIGTASGCRRCGRRAGSAARRSRPATCRGPSRSRRSRPKMCASARTSGSIRSRSCARPCTTCSAGGIVEGGSTITQQVAKLLLARQPGPRPRRGWSTKINEAVDRAAARASPDEERDPGALSEPRAVRQSDPGRGARVAGVLRPIGVDADADGSGVSGGPAATAVALQPVARSRGRAATRAAHPARDERSRLARRAGVRDRARRAREPQSRCRAAAGAALRRARALACGQGSAAPDRDDARRGPAADRRGHHRRASFGARGSPRGQRRRRRARRANRRMAGVGRIGQLLRHGERRDDRRRGVAAAAGIGAQALHLRRGVRARRRARRACWPTCRRSFRRRSRACSTARATTTATFAARCWRARPSRDPRTSRRSRSRPTSACRRWRGCCGRPACRRSIATPRTMASGSRSATRKCGSTSWWRPTR